MSDHALVRRSDDPDLLTMGRILVDSGYFKDTREQAQAIVKVLAGREYGMGPFAAMTGIHVVEGKPTLSAHLMAQGIKRSGRYDYRVLEHDSTRCTIAFYELANGKREEIGRSTYTVEDAARADLARKTNHQRYPRAMLFARALSEGYRTHCPDALGACGPTYVEGEIEPAQEVVTVEATVVDPPGEAHGTPAETGLAVLAAGRKRDAQAAARASLAERARKLPESPSRAAVLRDLAEDMPPDLFAEATAWVVSQEAQLAELRRQGEALKRNKQGGEPSRGDVSSPATTEILSPDNPKAGRASSGQGSSVVPAPIPPLSEAETPEGCNAEVATACSPERVAVGERISEQFTLERATKAMQATLQASLAQGGQVPRYKAPKVDQLDAMDPGRAPKKRGIKRAQEVTGEGGEDWA